MRGRNVNPKHRLREEVLGMYFPGILGTAGGVIMIFAGDLLQRVFGVILVFSGGFFLRDAWRAFILRRNEQRGRSGLCIRCAYDLTGNTSGWCSECGAQV